MNHHGRGGSTKRRGRPHIEIGLGKEGLVPAYVLDKEKIRGGGGDFIGMTEGAEHSIKNPDDFHEYPIPDSFLVSWLKK